MANTTLSQLTSIVGADVAPTDSFLIYDVSANAEKQITSGELKIMIGNGQFTFTTSGTSDGLTVTNTDEGSAAAPNIVFYRNSATPASSDTIGNIVFRGKSSTGINRNYAGIYTSITSPTNAVESGSIAFHTMESGTLSERVRITSTGNVGIGTISPTSALTVSQELNGGGPTIEIANPYYLETSTDERVDFQGSFYQNDVASLQSAGSVRFGKAGDFSNNASASSFMSFTTINAGTLSEKMRITSTGSVGIGNTSPDTDAILQLDSTTRGFLPPRMNVAQRDAITTPPAGLMIYNTDTNKLNFSNGSVWQVITSA
jgi:hypothetical protein